MIIEKTEYAFNNAKINSLSHCRHQHREMLFGSKLRLGVLVVAKWQERRKNMM